MKTKKIFLILLSIFVLFIFINSAFASEITGEDYTNSSNLNNPLETSLSNTMNGNTIIVNGSAYNQMTNPTIQTAINNANPGDTILITGTEYEHCHFVINKQLTIISNASTTMSVCPSNTQGSGGIGIFYIGEGGSGTKISGFTLNNDYGISYQVAPYAIYGKNIDDIKIENCNIIEVTSGQGIRLINTNYCIIDNCSVTKSTNGVYVTDSNNFTVKNSNIYENLNSGIYIGKNVSKSLLFSNNIHNNNDKGIYYGSSTDASVINNIITENMNDVYTRATSGYGIFVDDNITSMVIKGNYFYNNGYYGIFNSRNVRNLVDQTVEIIDNNYFIQHIERAVYTQNPQGGSGIVFIGSNYYVQELFCPSTYYEPGVLASNHERDLTISDIVQVKKGVYSVSFIRKDTYELAKSLNCVNVTFFLNKNNTNPIPTSDETYRISQIVNGTAIADFRNATYLPTKNNLTAVGDGIGIIKYDGTGDRPVAFSNISDSDIPVGGFTTLTGTNLTMHYKEERSYEVVLKNSNGIGLAGEKIYITINGEVYERITNNEGKASLPIELNPGTYTITSEFKETEEYYGSSTSNTIIITSNKIKTEIISYNLTMTYGLKGEYNVLLKNSNNDSLANQKVIIRINGVDYELTTNNKGIASLPIELNPGYYPTTVKFNGNDVYEESITLGYVRVNVIPKNNTKILSEDLTENYGKIGVFTATLTSDNKVIANEDIDFSVNGVIYTVKTNEDGKASLPIRLNPNKYTITTTYKGNILFNPSTVTNTINIVNPTTKLNTKILTEDFEKVYGQYNGFNAKLLDENNQSLAYQKIIFEVNGVSYSTSTDENGVASLLIELSPNKYTITTKYEGNNYYNAADTAINEINVLESIIIPKGMSNLEIQNILNQLTKKTGVVFDGEYYEDITLTLNNPVFITTIKNTTLKGSVNSPVITINADNCTIESLNLIAKNSSGININGNNTVIKSNDIKNELDPELLSNYTSGKLLLPGNGININSADSKIINNYINYFENGISLVDANRTIINNNNITKNNYGITFKKGVNNTLIYENDINNNIGLITMEVVEGPLGYGVYLKDSGENVFIIKNLIYDNYLGIYIDSKNSTGIVIEGNLITRSVCEGISFNVNYNFSENAIQPIVENNAIYNNAKGPSLIVLGEVSANPNGIYGPGEFNETLKLKLGANWYGTNIYTTWGEGAVGPGTICPRIKTSLITFNLTCIERGTYEAIFYNNGTQANDLPDFEYYFTLNYLTEKEQEVKVTIHEGKGIFYFNKENYYDSGNIIEGSSGSLNDISKRFRVTFTYNVSYNEIPFIRSIYVSNNGNDITGDGSIENPYKTINHAIEKSSPRELILLNSEIFTGAGNKNIILSKNITISSNLDKNAIIDASKTSRVFILQPNVILTLNKLTLINGRDYETGTEYSGGAISNKYATSEINLFNCEFKNNKANNRGGAILSAGTLNIKNCIFDGNSVTEMGGAVFSSGKLYINNSIFRNNTVPGEDKFTLVGGAVVTAGEGTILNSLFENNEAGASAAISNSGTGVIDNCTIRNNYARYCGGGVTNGGTLLINNTYIGYNYAQFYSGAILAPRTSKKVEIYNSILEYNSAGWFAPVINSYGDTVTIEKCYIFGNTYGQTKGLIRSDGYLDALYNWWGSNILTDEYHNTQSSGYINVTRWLIMNFTANETLSTGTTSELTVDLRHYLNNETKTIGEINGTLNLPVNVTFYDADGTIAIGELVNGSVTIQYTPKVDVRMVYAKLNNQILSIPVETVYYALSSSDVKKYYKGEECYEVTLIDYSGASVAGKTIEITVNGVTYNETTDAKGTAKLPIGLRPGNYNISAKYSNEKTIVKVDNKIEILTTITGENIDLYYKNGSSYEVKVLDTKGKPSTNQKVRLNINGVFYDVLTDSKGIAKLPIGLNAGTYIITAENLLNNELTSNNVTVYSRLYGNDLELYYKNGSTYEVKVLDTKGKPSTNHKVIFNINGVFYDGLTDSKGIAKLPIGLNAGTYIITAQDVETGEMTSNTIIVKPILISEDITLKYKNGTEYKVQALNDQGKPAINVTVCLNLNGILSNRTTNETGIASLPIDLNPGKYIITAEYKGFMTSNIITVLQ